MKVLLPSLINDQLFHFHENTSWREIYNKYETEGIDRNPFVHHLHKHGIEVVQYWINHEQAQKSWADEHMVSYNDNSWYLSILEAQILHEMPDAIYNTTLTVIPYEFIQKIKQSLSKSCLWVCFYGVTRTGEFRKFQEYDFFLTGFRELEKELIAESQKSYFFPHYFDDQLCDRIPNTKKSHSFTFLGSLCYKYDDHIFNNRRRLVEKLMDEANLQVWSHIPPELNCPKEALRQRWNAFRWESYHLTNSFPFPLHLLSRIPHLRKVKEWEVRPTPDYFFNARLTKKTNSAKYGQALYKCLSKSSITLNAHGQVDANFGQSKFAAGNIRLFEATGSGACLLTDKLSHLNEFFEPEKEIVTYESPSDAVEKARYLIDNPKERDQISRQGHQRAWKEHTSSIRAKQFAEILQKHA